MVVFHEYLKNWERYSIFIFVTVDLIISLSSANCSPTMHVFDRRAKLLQRERAAANREVEKFDFLKEEVGDLILFSLEEETTVSCRLVIGWQTECLTWQGEWRWRSTLAVEGDGSPGFADFNHVSF